MPNTEKQGTSARPPFTDFRAPPSKIAGYFKNLYNKVANRAEIEWDELEADLIAADLGVRVSLEIVEHLQGLGRKISADDVVTAAREHIAQVFPDDDHNLDLREDGKPLVILVVGVNGTGKTTSTAKLGNLFSKHGISVMLAAADTFRAAAVEHWSAGQNASPSPS